MGEGIYGGKSWKYFYFLDWGMCAPVFGARNGGLLVCDESDFCCLDQKGV
jgi:hypothetical protein